MSYGRGFYGKNYQSGLTNKEIAQKIRDYIKQEKDLNECKWSVVKNKYAIDVYLMEAPFDVVTEKFLQENDWWEDKKEMSGVDRWNEDRLNEKAQAIINKISECIQSYRMDDSAPEVDYFCTNFYYSVNIGKYDKPFKVVEKASKKTIEVEPIEAGNVKIIDYSEKSIAVIGDTKSIKDTLKSLGGRFNFRLSCGAGWIFPKTKEDELKKALSL